MRITISRNRTFGGDGEKEKMQQHFFSLINSHFLFEIYFKGFAVGNPI